MELVKKNILRVAGTALLVSLIDMFTSYLTFMVIFKETTEMITFTRSGNSLLTMIGMPISALYFCLMLTVLFYTFYRAIPGQGIMKAINYALLIWLFTTVSREFFTYLLYPVPFLSVISGIVKDLVFLIGGSLVINIIFPKENKIKLQ